MTTSAGPAHRADAEGCAVAHGAPRPEGAAPPRSLVVVFAGEVARLLCAFAAECGYRIAVVEPDAGRADDARAWAGAHGASVVASLADATCDEGTDVVATDHHRDELGLVLRDALAGRARWIGVMGNPRHVGPHHALLAELGVAPDEIARVRRPIGLNIGSRTPGEIAISTLAGLLADRAGRPGGFDFPAPADSGR